MRHLGARDRARELRALVADVRINVQFDAVRERREGDIEQRQRVEGGDIMPPLARSRDDEARLQQATVAADGATKPAGRDFAGSPPHAARLQCSEPWRCSKSSSEKALESRREVVAWR